MLQPITVLTADDVSTFTGINLSEALNGNISADRYIRDVTFLIENYIKSRVGFGIRVITENQEAVKTAICYQIEYQKLNGELQKYSMVDITKLQVGGTVADLRQWVVSPEVVNLLTVNGLLYRGVR